jgi:hypothetical protein
MNRRRLLSALLGLSLLAVTGCDKFSFMPQARQKKVAGYDAVKNGMSEKQVRSLLGEPSRRTGVDLEGSGQRATALTYVGAGKLIRVTLVGGAVIGKQKF